MRQLPDVVMRAPSIFYGLAVLVFLMSFGATWYEVKQASLQYASPNSPLVLSIMFRGFVDAMINGLFMAANGVLFHILLSFWTGFAAKEEEVGE